MHREQFEFGRDMILFVGGSATTDATVNPQAIFAFRNVLQIAPGVASTAAFMEPSFRNGLGGISKANAALGPFVNRLLIFGAREAGTGTWTATLTFARNGEATTQRAHTIDLPVASTAGATLPIKVVEDPFLPSELLEATPATSDILQMKADVTPGQAVASSVWVMALLVRGNGAINHGFGNQLSGAGWR